ncbi:MAG TPA: hypothetical protein VM095_18250 [Pyrinomonadaceae bacterium]|nr:hypothetical protein [Pyrinomonadaceae bacterium]
MMMKTAGRIFGVSLLLLTIGFSSVSGQSGAQKGDDEYYDKLGSLDVWTTEGVLRHKYGQYPEFLKVRFGKHSGFDRVVFEVDGDLIGYYVDYGKPPFQAEAGETSVKVRGKAFVEISLYPVSASDKSIAANEKRLAEQNKLKMPLIREAKPVEWFEGELRYVIGLKRQAPFRVHVLSNPTRLVVDFKH